MKSSESLAIIKMGETALLDAMLFQEVLSRNDATIATLGFTLTQMPLKQAFVDAWENILQKNYVPVFQVGVALLLALPSSPGSKEALKVLALEAQKIAASRALLRHDLMGRIYHRLLMSDIAKYYATYYTSIPAAWLLARFCLEAPNQDWPVAWEEPGSIAAFRVGDLACGSGTLLSAAYTAILDKHVNAATDKELDPEIKLLHEALLEKTLSGFDVLPYAAHLSAVTLALHNPSSIFNSTNIYSLPLTAKTKPLRLGSIAVVLMSDGESTH